MRPSHTSVLAVPCGLFVVLLLWLSVAYWTSPRFLDHFEAQVASVAHRVWSGHPVYHPLDAPDRYSTILGPNTYLWAALWQGPNPRSFSAAKTPGVFACWLTMAALATALWRRFGRAAALVGCGVLAMIGLVFHQFLFWNRSDPLILLCLASALAGTTLGSATVGWIVIGAAAGCAFNAKFHAVVFFMVVLPWLERRAWRSGPVCAGLAAASGAAALPYLLPQVSAANYLAWLSMIRPVASPLREFGWVAAMLVLLSLPAVARALARPERRALGLVSWSVPVLFLLYAAARYGLEGHHMLLLGVAVAACVAEWLDARRSAAGWALIGLFVAAVGTQAAFNWNQTRQVIAALADFRVVEADMEPALQRSRGLSHAMGYAGMESYGLSDTRALFTFRGQNRLYLDAAAMMDHRTAGVPLPEATIDAIRREEVDVWWIPDGAEPFTLTLHYRPDLDVFPAEFRRVFHEHYRPAGRTQFFVLWLARKRDRLP